MWKSETIAGSVFAANDSLGTEAIDKLEKVFTEKINKDSMEAAGICTGDACLITDERAWGVVPATDQDYDGVRHVCDVTKSEKCAS